MRTTLFWYKLHQVYSQIIEIVKPNDLKVFWGNKTKGPEHDSQNRLRSPMADGGEP